VQAIAGNESGTVSWRPGAGSTPATRFHVSYDGLGQPRVLPGNATSATLDGLTNGESYVFEVWASNEFGESAHVRSNAIEPNDEVPGTPGSVTAVAGDASADLTWTAADGRGNDIANYVVTVAPGGARHEVAGTARSFTVPGLANGTAYTFTVAAVNELGNQGEASAPSNSVTPYGPPGAFQLTAAAGDGAASLSWTAAPSVTDVTYEIDLVPAVGGSPFTTNGTSYNLTGLTNGVAYSIRVTATNDRGAGGYSDATITPGRAPAVSNVAANRTGDRQFQVTFNADNGGHPLTGCTVTSSSGASAPCDASSGTGSATLDVPTYNTAYTFSVSVTNDMGTGTGSGSGTSAWKPLVVETDAARWDGALCTWNDAPRTRPYYATPNHTCTSELGYIPLGTTVLAKCWTEGGEINDDYYNYSNLWIQMDRGYMNVLYFTNFNAAEDNLPHC
jgi:hypothetical protein